MKNIEKNAAQKDLQALVLRLKSEWQSMSESPAAVSDKCKRSLFLKIREIENENSSFIPWELSLRYLPKFSLASTFAAILCVVTFQLSQGDLQNVSMNEQVESDYSELIASNEQIDDVDVNDLVNDEQQEEYL